MGSISATESGLNIVVAGAGIAGLAAATALTHNGRKHKIIILESHSCLNEFGASTGITPNGTGALRSLGLESEFAKVVTWNNRLTVSDGFTNELVGYLPQNKNDYSKTNYGDENWNINRQDYQNVLADAAQAGGAKLIFDVEIDNIDAESCVVTCTDGQSFAVDMIVGADGIKSTVRKHLPKLSHVEPVAWVSETVHCSKIKDDRKSDVARFIGRSKRGCVLHCKKVCLDMAFAS